MTINDRTWEWDPDVDTPEGGAWVLIPVSMADADLASEKAYAAALSAQSAEDALSQVEDLVSTVGNTFIRTDTAAQGLSATQKTNAKTNLDLQNVNNTSDANKPISTATQAALDTKADASALSSGLAAKLDKVGGTLTGDLTISKTTPTVRLQSASLTDPAALVSQVSSTLRWSMYMGSGGTGDSWALYRYNDSGAQIDSPLSIRRDTGAVTIPGAITASQGVKSPSGVFGVSGLASVLEGSVYRHRVWQSDAAISGASAYAYTEHNPGTGVYHTFVIHGQTFTMANSGTGSSAGGWVATSDNRVKYHVRPIESALDKVDQLGGYTYIRQDMADLDGSMPTRAGLIAQEVLRVLPEAVHVPKNYDPVKNQGDLLSLDSYGVLGLLVAAIKELRAEVRALQQTQPQAT